MKKSILIISSLLLFTGISAANASSVYIGIGDPQPVYVAPQPYVVAPPPVYYTHPYYYRYHNYDWKYWRDRRDPHWRERGDHDHGDDHDRGRHGGRN